MIESGDNPRPLFEEAVIHRRTAQSEITKNPNKTSGGLKTQHLKRLFNEVPAIIESINNNHSSWVDKQINSFLQRSKPLKRKDRIEKVDVYEKLLSTLRQAISQEYKTLKNKNAINVKLIAEGSTSDFFEMLETASKLGFSNMQSLHLAEKSYVINPDSLEELTAEEIQQIEDLYKKPNSAKLDEALLDKITLAIANLWE